MITIYDACCEVLYGCGMLAAPLSSLNREKVRRCGPFEDPGLGSSRCWIEKQLVQTTLLYCILGWVCKCIFRRRSML